MPPREPVNTRPTASTNKGINTILLRALVSRRSALNKSPKDFFLEVDR